MFKWAFCEQGAMPSKKYNDLLPRVAVGNVVWLCPLVGSTLLCGGLGHCLLRSMPDLDRDIRKTADIARYP